MSYKLTKSSSLRETKNDRDGFEVHPNTPEAEIVSVLWVMKLEIKSVIWVAKTKIMIVPWATK